MDLCGKSSGFADFEDLVDRGSAVIFHADSGLCLSYVQILCPKRNLDHRSFFSLGRNVILSSSMLPSLLFGRNLQWHSHVPVYLWTSTLLFSDVVVVSDLNKNFGGSTDLAKKRHGSADLHTPLFTPLSVYWSVLLSSWGTSAFRFSKLHVGLCEFLELGTR